MKNKFLCLLMYLLKVNRKAIYLFFFFCSLATVQVFGEEATTEAKYITCNDVSIIESFASDDYKLEKGRGGNKTTENIGEINKQYINYINFPYNAANIDYLFQPLRINKANDKIEGTFLTCGIEVGDVICDSERLISNDGKTCKTTFEKKDGNKIKTVKINDCTKYSENKSTENKKSCYPETHICNKYKNDAANKYYSIVKKSDDAAKKEFYIFEKRIIKENINEDKKELRQNCDFEVLPCDYKIVNESNNKSYKPSGFTDDGYINVVFNNPSNLNNQKFVNNIFGNLGDNMLFINPENTENNRFSTNNIKTNKCNKTKYDEATKKYSDCNKKCFLNETEGTNGYTNCKDSCENEYNNNYKIPCKNDFIMRSPYYFKYIVYNDVNKDVYYFVKNINASNFGKVCNGYLPNCKYIYPDEGLNVLYNNTVTKEGGSNIGSRATFYKDNIKSKINFNNENKDEENRKVREEYLWYVGEQNISEKKCLSIISNDDKLTNYDIGYCSDLTDDGSTLKYPNGLTSGYVKIANCNFNDSSCNKVEEFKAPNCYLKSCADLTVEELEKIIKINNRQAKYCSEYYWLEDKYGMKYFPKENPIYCSDLENVYIEDNDDKVSVISEDEYNKINTNGKRTKKIISQLKFRDKDFEIRKHTFIDKKKYCKLEEKTEKVVYTLPSEIGGTKEVENTYTDYNCPDTAPREERYYSYGGGINKRKNNCYLKSCFSMTEDERNRVANANMLNLSEKLQKAREKSKVAREKCGGETNLTNEAFTKCTKEMEKYNNYINCKNENESIEDDDKKKNCENDYPYDSSLMDCDENSCNCSQKEFNDIKAKKCLEEDYMSRQIDLGFFEKENLPIYCDDTFMISSRFDNNFNDLNLNVIPCYELKDKIAKVNIDGNNILNSNNLIDNYNMNTSYVLCRNNYSSSFNNDKISDNVLKEDDGSILNSVFSYSEENEKFSGNYNNSSSNHTFDDSEYYIKIKYNSADYADPNTDSLEIEKYRDACQNLDNNILYYNARIPEARSNAGLNADYFDINLVGNLVALDNGYNDSGTDKEKFLEEYVYKCKNYKSKYNKSAAIIIDCGLYHDFDATGKTESLGNDIISTMEEDVKIFLKNVCMTEVESRKPDDREILTNVVDLRGSMRSDEYNWLLKPIPLENYSSRNKNKYNNYKSNFKFTSPTLSKMSNGCMFFENYDDAAVNEVVGVKMADAIPLNKTNYISTTNFSDPLRRRKEGEKCKLEPYCENDLITKNVDAYSLDQKMEKCQVGLDEKGEPKMERCSVTVCARYPTSVSNSNLNGCGVRENSIFRDKCLPVPINGDKDERIIYLSNGSYLNIGKKPDRLRTKIVDDKILVFRDTFVNYTSSSNIAGTPHFEDKLEKKCNGGLCIEKDLKFDWGDKDASKDYWEVANAIGLETELYNIRNKKFIYFDADQYYQRHIAAKGVTYGVLGAIYIAGCATVGAGCAIANFFDKDQPDFNQCFHTCVAEALYQTTDLTVKDFRGKFIYYMNSSRNHILDYFDLKKLPYNSSTYIPDSGLVIGGNIIDNNNYLYMYYPRYDTIERDIRSKMESNININGERFYHNTVLAKDIIRACKLERFVGDRNVDKSKDGRQHKGGEMNYYESADYEFIYYKLDKNGNQIAECWEDNIEKCLDPEILRCLKSYDVSFIKHNSGSDDVSDDFIMRNGRHLKKYNDCNSLEIFSSCTRDGGEYNQYIPTNVIAYTGNKYSNEELKNRDDCKLDEYGKPLGDLSKCRGFEDDTNGNKLFYTETQSVPVPLHTHPFLFYTLITPKNTPELFDPTFILSQYYKFSDYYKDNNILGVPKDIEKVNDIITDFFYPAFKFNYDFINGTNDSDYNNKYQNRNNFVSRIEAKNKRSHPYIVEYSSNNIPNAAPFKYIMDKTYDIDKKGCYTPKVCIYEIAVVNRAINEELGVCAIDIPEYKDIGTGDIKNSGKDAKEQIIKLAVSNNKPTECIKIVDTGVGCYERNIPYLDKFILKLDKDSLIYNTPYINAYLIPNDPNKMDFNYITSNNIKETYIMRENNESDIIEIDSSFENRPIEDRVVKRAYSEKQGFGLNFERSYCSQMYFDYYTSLDTVQREEEKRGKKDKALINRLKTKISTINTIIRPECDKENGEEGEYIIDEGVSSRDIALSNEEKEEGKKQCKKTKNECIKECGVNSNKKCESRCIENYNKCEKKYTSNEIISRKTTIVKKYNESYGGFNEICVADNDIKNILKVYKSQNPGTTKGSLPKVIAFADKEGRGIKTKCLLNSVSRANAKCLRAEKVYIYCDQNEIGIGECKTPKFDIKSLKWGYIKEIDCRSLLSNPDINEDNVEKIKACYKGGFNYNGNIYTKDGEQEDICACEILGSGQSVPEGYFMIREMTPREYGLCVNLVTPEVCPTIRYYDSSNKYTDDNLILGLTKTEIEEREKAGLLKPTDYQQHYWRTSEKVAGFMQSTMFSASLEHAEFDSTIFCDIPDDKIREFLEEKKLSDSTIDVDKILKEKGEKYNKTKEEYDKLNNYYDKYCIGGTRIINGECNGYWRWSENNLNIAPQAACTVQQDNQGNKIYEYVLIGKGCERYSCEGIAYDEKDGYIGDEKELALETANVFKYSEIDAFSLAQKELDFRTYLIKEEQDPITVDRRGSSHGFASWKKVICEDHASLEVAYDCLTGYSPAGLNYFINNKNMVIGYNDSYNAVDINWNSFSEYAIDVNYDDLEQLLSTPTTRNNFIKHIVGQNNKYDSLKKDKSIITKKVERYPTRKCNQKGQWMTVNDVYNLSLIDQAIIGNNYYYNNYNYKNEINPNSLNYWLQLYDFNKILTNKEYNRNVSYGGYCERNICLAINPENENIYEKEGIYNKFRENINTYARKEKIENGSRYQVWKHSGGASWENVGAARNESGKINEYGTDSDISKNINRIFKEKKDSENNNPIKYLKKVQGICRTDYGYYNRGSVFKNKDFNNQLSSLKSNFEDEKNRNRNDKKFAIDQRRLDFGADENSGTKPERFCTSYGVWGPVFNKCFRGCEMLDMYHSNFTNEFSNKIELNKVKKAGERWENYKENKYFYIENNDIESTIITELDDSPEGEMEKRFKSFGLHISPDNTPILNKNEDENNKGSFIENNKGLAIGDYITGGANWPRTIVNEIYSEIDRDINSNKYGLRYVEVEGECDNSFNTDNDERVRSFMKRGRDENNNGIAPKRRCYEDGSWGQVYENTRCVLQKTCRTFDFTLYDLMLLMQIYDSKEYNDCKDSKNINCKNDIYDNYIDENYSNNLIRKLNKELSKTISYGYYPPNTSVMENKGEEKCTDYKNVYNENKVPTDGIKTCHIYNFKPTNAVGGEALSYEANVAYDDRGFKSTGLDADGKISSSKDGKLICNMTESIGERLTGWSFGITDIGDYFIPNTCNEGLKNSETDPDYSDDIDLLVHHIDRNKNFVPVIYNVNNDTRVIKKGEKNIRESSILHYAEETKLHYLYNNMHLNAEESFDTVNYPKATNIENESKKDVKIGSKFYKSYQMYYRCNEDYFYNYLNAGEDENTAEGKNIAYYHNDILLECKKDGNNGYKFAPNDKAEKSKVEPDAGNPLYPKNCYVRSCGSNSYHQHWSLSYPVEFFEKFDNTDNIYNSIKFIGGSSISRSSRSYMKCPKITAEGEKDDKNGTIETAFILNDDLGGDNIKKYVVYYGQDKADAAVYRVRKFVTKISADCRNRIESETENRKTINGTTANTLAGNERSYDIQKYGELDKNNLPRSFCRDLNKKESDCKTFTESQVAGGIVPKPDGSEVVGNNVFLDEIKDKGGYCVPMACKGKGLRLEFKGDRAKIFEDKNGFNLAKSYYNFGDYVVIESVEGDFNAKSDNPNGYPIAETTNRGRVGNRGGLCPTHQDLYSVGMLFPFDFNTYINETQLAKEQQIYINKCFSWLINDSAINNSSNSGYTEVIKNSLYVGFNNTTFKEEKGITSVYDAVSNYSLDATKEAEFKEKAAEFIVDNLLFKDGGIERGDYNFNSIIENSLKTDFDDAKRNAIKFTDDYFKGDNKEDIIDCYSEETEGENFKSVISGNINKNLKKVKYNDIIGDSSKSAILNEYVEIIGNKDGDFYIKDNDGEEGFIGFLLKEKESNCKGTIMKKIKFSNVSATSQKYKKTYNCSTGYTYNSTKKKCVKGDEEVEPQIILDTNDYKCFYDIDNTNFGKVSNYCDTSEFNVNNCTDKYLINNKNEVYNDPSGNEYVTKEGATSNSGCENRDFIADEELEITGDAIQSLEAYINIYNTYYSEEIDKLKNKLKNTITNSKSSDIWYELLEEYFNIYKMEDFLNTGSNFEYYKHYISKLEDYDSVIVTKIEGKYNINVTTSTDEGKIQLYLLNYFSTTNNKISCNATESYNENTEETTIVNCTGQSQEIKNTLNNFYKNIFINFFNDPSNLKKIKSFVKEYEKTYENCKKIYSDYINVRNIYNEKAASNKSSFGSGLFMTMKCTPEGWIVLDKLTCKNRCSGASSNFRVDPVGNGDWKNVRLNVINLRYSKIASGLAFGHSRAYCYMGDMGTQHTRHAKVYLRCNENGNLETLSYSVNNGQGRFDKESDWWERWKAIFFLGLGCKAHAYYEVKGGNENFYTKCENTWHLGTGAELTYCGQTSFDKEEVGAKIWFTD